MSDAPHGAEHLHQLAHDAREEMGRLLRALLDEVGPDHTFDDVVDHVAANSAGKSMIDLEREIEHLASHAGLETNPEVIRPWARAINEGRYTPTRQR